MTLITQGLNCAATRSAICSCSIFNIFFGLRFLILSRHRTTSMAWQNGSWLFLNSRTRSGSSRGADLSLIRHWVKENLVACCALALWISAEYPVSTNCSTVQATSLHGNRANSGHTVNTDASPLNETQLERTLTQDRQCTYYVTFRHFRALCRLKAIIIAYSEYVSVALVIQHAWRMHHIIICSPPGSTIFSKLSHKRHDFRKKRS